MTGHGGKEFLKFQDSEEIGSHDVADAIAQMWEKKRCVIRVASIMHHIQYFCCRYNELFFVADTCQAASMYEQIYSPNVLAAASSLTGENSYSHHQSAEIGVAVIDRFTYYNLETLEKVHRQDNTTVDQLVRIVLFFYVFFKLIKPF
jgi:GPI-anchor transamidase subunit K